MNMMITIIIIIIIIIPQIPTYLSKCQQSVPKLKHLYRGLSTRRLRFYPWAIHGQRSDNGTVFVQVFPPSPISITPHLLHTYSIISHMLVTGLVSKLHLKIYNSCLCSELLYCCLQLTFARSPC